MIKRFRIWWAGEKARLRCLERQSEGFGMMFALENPEGAQRDQRRAVAWARERKIADIEGREPDLSAADRREFNWRT